MIMAASFGKPRSAPTTYVVVYTSSVPFNFNPSCSPRLTENLHLSVCGLLRITVTAVVCWQPDYGALISLLDYSFRRDKALSNCSMLTPARLHRDAMMSTCCVFPAYCYMFSTTL